MSEPKSKDYTVTIVVLGAVLLAGLAVAAVLRSIPIAPPPANLPAPGAISTTEVNGNPDVDLGRAPTFALENMDGRTVTDADLKGSIWAVGFIFTTCGGPCPAMTEVMKLIQSKTQDIPNFRLVTITVDPERDVPAALREYAKQFDVDTTRWYFLRGSKEETSRIENQGFNLGNPMNLLEHDERLTLVRPDGRIYGYYMAAGPNRAAAWQALVKDAHTIAAEAAK